MIAIHDDTGFITTLINDMANPEHNEFYLSQPNTIHTVEPATHHAHYVKNGAVIDRPTLDVNGPIRIKADGKDAFELKCSKISVDGTEYDVTGGKLKFVTEDAGTYIFASVFPYQEQTFKVIAE